MKIALRIYLSLFLLINYSCNTTEPPTPPPPEQPKAIKLNLVEATCTESFIKVTAEDTALPANITLNRDENLLFNFTLTKPDTIVIDETLLPGANYVYQTRAIINGKEEIGDTLQIRTLDTTSHNFTWQKFEFGEGASSVFHDVAIIDENNIYAVGEIYLSDSTGQPDQLLYNIMHWNGIEWKAKRAQTDFRGNLITIPLEGIFAFSSNDIWLIGSLPIHGDGNQWQIYDLRTMVDPNLSLSKAWGKSSNDIYFVGRTGSIAYYNGSMWKKIESGTDWNILDIWGDANPFKNQTEIICGVNKGLNQPGPWSDIIRIKEDFTTVKLDLTGLGQVYAPIWFKSGIRYYIVGDGLYEKTYKDTTKWINLNENRTITNNFMSSISGNGLNNIVVAGAYGEFIHYNGSTWKSLRDQTSLENGTYYSVAVKSNIVAAVGQNQNQGVILIGHRQ